MNPHALFFFTDQTVSEGKKPSNPNLLIILIIIIEDETYATTTLNHASSALRFVEVSLFALHGGFRSRELAVFV